MCGTCLDNCCCDPGYCLSVSAEGKALTFSKDIVTATATASACSSISYEDAWLNATALAKFNAEIVAKNDANIIDQTLLIVASNSLIPLVVGLTLGDSSNQYSGVFSNIGNFTDSLNIGNSGLKLTSSGGSDASPGGLLINGLFGLVNQISISKSGSNGIGIGPGSLSSLTSGTNNLAFGLNGLNKVTSGSLNAGFGPGALQNNQRGNGNFAIGAYVLSNLVSGEGNTGLGIFAGLNIKGSYNTAIGIGSQVPKPNGDHQIQIGTQLDTTFVDNLQLPGTNNTVAKWLADSTSLPILGLIGAVIIVALQPTSPSFSSATLEIGSEFSTKYSRISSIQIANMPVNGIVTINVTNSASNGPIPITLTSPTGSSIYGVKGSLLIIPIGKSIITLQQLSSKTSSSTANPQYFVMKLTVLDLLTPNVIAGYKVISNVSQEFTSNSNNYKKSNSSFVSQINNLIGQYSGTGDLAAPAADSVPVK